MKEACNCFTAGKSWDWGNTAALICPTVGSNITLTAGVIVMIKPVVATVAIAAIATTGIYLWPEEKETPVAIAPETTTPNNPEPESDWKIPVPVPEFEPSSVPIPVPIPEKASLLESPSILRLLLISSLWPLGVLSLLIYCLSRMK